MYVRFAHRQCIVGGLVCYSRDYNYLGTCKRKPLFLSWCYFSLPFISYLHCTETLFSPFQLRCKCASATTFFSLFSLSLCICLPLRINEESTFKSKRESKREREIGRNHQFYGRKYFKVSFFFLLRNSWNCFFPFYLYLSSHLGEYSTHTNFNFSRIESRKFLIFLTLQRNSFLAVKSQKKRCTLDISAKVHSV